MGRKRTTDPKLYFIASEGVYAATIGGRRCRFGPDKAEAERRRQAAVGQWLLRGCSPRPAESMTVAELTTAYYRHCLDRQAAGGLDKTQVERIAVAVEAVQAAHGPEPAAEFGPLKLQALRRQLLHRPSRRPVKVVRVKRKPGRPRKNVAPAEQPPAPAPRTLSRRYVNHLVGCLKTCWGWAARNELVPGDLVHALREVKALKKREGGRETPPRLPVSPAVVVATLPHCHRVVATMIRVQRLAGMRPQDVCRIKPRLVSRSADHVLYPLPDLPVTAFPDAATGVLLWVYCPEEHKGAWREKPRIIVLGPKAQAELAPYLDRDPDRCCFSPREAMDEMRASRGQAAVYGESRQPNGHYTTQSYGRAIAAAARRAGVAHWSPHALRRDAGTAASNTADEHTAAAVLGDHPDLMRVYSRTSMGKAGGYMAVHG